MASWERLGEAQKYKATADANVNTRHVGATLRRISMDERIEERKTLKANQKKGAITMDLSDDEEDEEPLQRADSAVCGKSSPTANGDSNGVKATSMDSSTTASTSKNQENGVTGVDDDVVIDDVVIEDLGVEDDVVMELPKGKAVEIDDLDIACVDEDDVAPGTKRPQRQISVGEDEPAPAVDDLASGTKPPKPPERQITIASIAEDEPAPADADKHDAADEAAAEKAIPQCSKGHPLTEYRAHTAGTCDGSCGSKVVTGQHVMDCRPCNYWLCDKCSGCQAGIHNGAAKEVAATKTAMPGAREVVHDLDALAPKKKRSRDSGSNKQKESGKDPQGEIPQGKSSTSVVEDLEAVSVVELDEADTSGGGAAARKARRRVQAARAKAAPAPKQVLLLE